MRRWKTLTACAAVRPILPDVGLLRLRQEVHFPLRGQHLVVRLQALSEHGVHRQPHAFVVAQVRLGPAGVRVGEGGDAEVLDASPHLPLGFKRPLVHHGSAAVLHAERYCRIESSSAIRL